MDCQQLAAGQVRAYLNADMVEPDLFELAGGTAAVISARRPGKPTANEDAAAVIAAGEGSAVLVVADGCGGMASGEQAARLAIQCLVERIQAVIAGAEGQTLRTAILDGVEAANRQILDLKTGAGATLAVLQLENGQARPYHVGDAQIVMVGGRGKVKLLTPAHSPVGYAQQAGMLEEHEALDHEERHLVSNFLGSEEMHVEVGSGRKVSGRDGVLVASDGVLDNLKLEEIVGFLKSGSAAKAAAKIAAVASERMRSVLEGQPHKPDDFTLIVFSQRGCRPRVDGAIVAETPAPDGVESS
jgi:serine/threonine protein phosphatase PrpC